MIKKTKEDAKTWMDEDREGDITAVEYDITSTSNDFNVLTINSFIDAAAIVLPPYQRNYIWDKARASKLIESLIIGLPVPQIFLYEEKRNNFAILDGQQRLMSIYFFTKGRFPKKSQRANLREVFARDGVFSPRVLADEEIFEPFDLQLTALDGEQKSPLHGLNFATLPEDHLKNFNLRPLRCVVIKQNEPKDDNSSVYEIFHRLNSGGMQLKPQEIRSSLYSSKFYEFLQEANKDPRWREIIDVPNVDDQLRDVELLLRALAMLCYADEYKPSMTRFLNRFSNHAKKKFATSDISRIRKIFDIFLSSVEGMGPEAFQVSDRFSIALFEAALYGRHVNAWQKRSAPVRADKIELKKLKRLAADIQPSLQEGTSKQQYVMARLEAGVKLLGV